MISLAYFLELSTLLQIFPCYVTLKKNIESEDGCLRTTASRMLKKYKNYWSEFSLILAIAIVVDPRYKLQFVRLLLQKA